MKFKLLISLTLILLITSCGLNYATIPTPINQTAERRKAINMHLLGQFAKDSLVYSDMAWGKTRTIKPLSYKQLDSLYAIKYSLEREGRKDAQLEKNIDIQRQIALNDTAPILYLEDHLFSVRKGDIMTVYSSIIETDKSHVIRNANIHSSNDLDAEYIEEFKIYSFEESFLHRGFAPEMSERAFYIRYKTRADELSGEAKDTFINHTLQLMRRAQTARSVNTKALISEVVRYAIHKKKRFSVRNEKFETMDEVISKVDDKDVITGYKIVYAYQTENDGLTTSYRYYLELDPFLKITKMALM